MMSLTILGNNSAIPAFGRYPTAQVLQTPDEDFLIDCGEGTQMQLAKYKLKKSRISRIFISHLHGDHYFGLIGLLNSMSLLNRNQDLHLYAPKKLEAILQIQLDAANTQLNFALHFHALENAGNIVSTSKISVDCFPVSHGIECWGFVFREKKNPRKIDPTRVKQFEIPASFYEKLQAGEDYTNKKGTIIPNSEVTLPATPPKSYAYCADTIFDLTLADKISNVSLLYHETTYPKGNEEKASARFHCTSEQAATIAKAAKVEKLIIGHFSAKYEDLNPFLIEASAIFPDTELAIEGCCFKI